jgi:hypothetical protein
MSGAMTMEHNVIPFPDPIPPALADPEALMTLIDAIGHPDLRRYLIEQINSARSLEDVAATVELVEAVMGKRAC